MLGGLSDTVAMAFDSSGDLFAANSGGSQNNTVSEFTPGSTTPTATLTGLSTPTAMAFDSSGNLYVVNNFGDTVSEFAPGSLTPTNTLTGLSGPEDLTFDSSGNLFVSNNFAESTVSEYQLGGQGTTSPPVVATSSGASPTL